MLSAVQSMLERYSCKTVEDYEAALKEVIQEIALLGLSRAGFFDKAAFYGGTALRLFYGLNRFSEDLDFSLLAPEKEFNITPYAQYVQDELGAYGFKVEVTRKQKTFDSTIESAFIKGETLVHLLEIKSISPPVKGVHPQALFKIKLEVDTQPPPEANYEVKYLFLPIPFSVRVFTAPSLLAGKIHAVLCRGWKNRIKGRDLYDYSWYLSQGIPVNLKHLEQRLRQTHPAYAEALTALKLKQLLEERFEKIDYGQAKGDVRPFIVDPFSLEVWSAEFFKVLTEKQLRLT